VKSVPVNGGALRQRLLDMGCSDRAFADRTGLGLTGIRTVLLRGHLNTSTTLTVLDSVLRESGLTAAEFLDPAPGPHDDGPAYSTPTGTTGDAAMLAHVLLADPRRQDRTVLARALDWDYERLDAALRTADTIFGDLGVEAHENAMGIALRPLDARATEATGRLTVLRDHEDGIPNGAARVLHDLWAGELDDRGGGADLLLKLGALRRRGLVETDTSGKRLTLSDDVLFAFDVS